MHGTALTLGSVFAQLNTKCIVQTCRTANHQGLLNPKPTKSPFVYNGFNNWKKARKKFREHENSSIHKDASHKLRVFPRVGKGQRSRAYLMSFNNERQSSSRNIISVVYASVKGWSLVSAVNKCSSISSNLFLQLIKYARDL